MIVSCVNYISIIHYIK